MMSSPAIRPDRIRIPLSQKAVRGLELDQELRDSSIAPDRSLLVSDMEGTLRSDERLVSMGEMIVEHNGGSLRTFSGNRTHEMDGGRASNRDAFSTGRARRNARL